MTPPPQSDWFLALRLWQYMKRNESFWRLAPSKTHLTPQKKNRLDPPLAIVKFGGLEPSQLNAPPLAQTKDNFRCHEFCYCELAQWHIYHAKIICLDAGHTSHSNFSTNRPILNYLLNWKYEVLHIKQKKIIGPTHMGVCSHFQVEWAKKGQSFCFSSLILLSWTNFWKWGAKIHFSPASFDFGTAVALWIRSGVYN